MIYPIKLVATALAAFLVHFALGWAWTFAAGVGAGVWQGRGGWHLGALAVGIEWAGWVIYSYTVDARAVHLMTETIGSVLGNLPFFAVVALTLLIGMVLGGLGGGVGTRLRSLLVRRRTARAAA